jgi:hypothetical protein
VKSGRLQIPGSARPARLVSPRLGPWEERGRMGASVPLLLTPSLAAFAAPHSCDPAAICHAIPGRALAQAQTTGARGLSDKTLTQLTLAVIPLIPPSTVHRPPALNSLHYSIFSPIWQHLWPFNRCNLDSRESRPFSLHWLSPCYPKYGEGPTSRDAACPALACPACL